MVFDAGADDHSLTALARTVMAAMGICTRTSLELKSGLQQRWLQQVCVDVEQDTGHFQRAP